MSYSLYVVHTSAFHSMHTYVFTHSCCGHLISISKHLHLWLTRTKCTCSEDEKHVWFPVCCSAQPQYVCRLLKTHISSHEIEHTRYYLERNLKEAWHRFHSLWNSFKNTSNTQIQLWQHFGGSSKYLTYSCSCHSLMTIWNNKWLKVSKNSQLILYPEQ